MQATLHPSQRHARRSFRAAGGSGPVRGLAALEGESADFPSDFRPETLKALDSQRQTLEGPLLALRAILSRFQRSHERTYQEGYFRAPQAISDVFPGQGIRPGRASAGQI